MAFLEIFTQMHWIAIILLCVGFVFFIVEVFVPGFGFFGIMGIIAIVAGVVFRIVQGVTVEQALTLILLVIGAIVLGFIFILISAKCGFLGRSGLVENKSTLDKDYNKPDRDLKKLIGKTGKTISKLSLAGQAKIKGEIYDVMSISSYIEAGTNIKVVDIKDNTIMVRKWFE